MYKSSADGIAKKGKTEGKNLGNSGPTSKIQTGKNVKRGVSSMKMKEVGRNLARLANQKAGRGR